MTGDITPISFKILSVVSDCEIKSRVRSHTFRIKSAFFIHDKVDLNASIRSVGISLMKPTASKKTTLVFSESYLSRRRVECGEESVFGKRVATGQKIQKSGFSGVGIACKRDG